MNTKRTSALWGAETFLGKESRPERPFFDGENSYLGLEVGLFMRVAVQLKKRTCSPPAACCSCNTTAPPTASTEMPQSFTIYLLRVIRLCMWYCYLSLCIHQRRTTQRPGGMNNGPNAPLSYRYCTLPCSEKWLLEGKKLRGLASEPCC